MQSTFDKIKEIIEVAEIGGWKGYEGNDNCSYNLPHILLDPEFWKAIGKVKYWEENYYCGYCGNKTKDGCAEMCAYFKGKQPEWQYHALHFMELNFTKDFDSAVEYLYQLIKE